MSALGWPEWTMSDGPFGHDVAERRCGRARPTYGAAMKSRRIAAALLAPVSLVLAGPGEAQAARAGQWVTVIRWGDGDTLDTTLGRVRLIGVDTPELGQ